MSDPRVVEGTEAWFLTARQGCVDHLRALASVHAADRYVSKLLESTSSHDAEMAGALHSAAVTAYAQAFTEARTRDGSVQYRTRPLRKAAGFDNRLHDHLIDLRNELIAHADYAALPPAMDMQMIGDLPVAITLKAKRLAGMQSRALTERYQRHFRACMAAIEALLNDELRQLADEARKHFDAFNATHNVPPVAAPMKATGQFEDLPPGIQVPEPTFEGDLDGYAYITLEHRLPLVESGKHVVRDADGKAFEVDIDVTWPSSGAQ